MRRHPIFDELDASLAALVLEEPVELVGNWLPTTRRTYETAQQRGTGSGRFVDVIDRRWRGTLACSQPVAGIAFLVTAAEVFWAKTAPAATGLDVDVSLHAYADYSPKLATFAARLGGAALPGIPVASGVDLTDVCTMRETPLTTARVEQLAQTEEAAIGVLLLHGRLLKIGRHRLWRVREQVASSLSPRAREILTRRRGGSIAWEPLIG
ncbi:MAG TPA: hypothetical protein VM818_00980 [Vicinamibacterales bacterium]|nr:hypothetical protein [Vicinamibacterales bacterium]